MKIPPLVGLFLAIATLNIGLAGWLRADMLAGQTELRSEMGELRTRMDRLEIGQNELRERMARLEGTLSGLLARPGGAAPPKADAPR